MTESNGDGGLFKTIRETRKTVARGVGDGRLKIDDADAFPLLTQLLTMTPAGAKGAKPGRVAFFVQNGVLTCCLSVPSMVAVAFLDAEGFQDALCRVERKLAEGTIEWKEDRGTGRK